MALSYIRLGHRMIPPLNPSSEPRDSRLPSRDGATSEPRSRRWRRPGLVTLVKSSTHWRRSWDLDTSIPHRSLGMDKWPSSGKPVGCAARRCAVDVQYKKRQPRMWSSPTLLGLNGHKPTWRCGGFFGAAQPKQAKVQRAQNYIRVRATDHSANSTSNP
ncbi:hypothetical protein GQ53DRAFT_180488 [Thozetella sp. PMI_491]|nr:hypothetical protein GQ53DRAFT_180488 [Thozetella sp. PMI_491]